ncbi:uncharacterized protein isoform X1 [Danio rerio]|uniref:Uncharacterized protein isoform X1 n=2 Tax=Danio rerio TaxID=7955 RepID=A0AC58G0R9_DANRE
MACIILFKGFIKALSTISVIMQVSTLILAFIMVTPVMTTAANLTDPCNNYTVLNDAWRSVNNTYNTYCDQSVSWSGWYRLFINGLSAHIPDTCVAMSRCGTSFPLWIRGGHPTVQDGVVTRDVCANAYTYCCFYGSYPIRVKACPGNYYVYELLKPTICNLAYCADVGSVIISSTAATPVVVTPDPCYTYTVLDDPWRANSSQKSGIYKRDIFVYWSGWYRLFINGLSAHIPDTCVAVYSCGTLIPLWIRGGHPTVKDGVVTRDVCGNDGSGYCCYFGSFSIRVKACPGNYYVYELRSPSLESSVYCAVVSNMSSINTTVTPQTSSAESSSSWVLITAGVIGAAFVMCIIVMVFMLIRRKRVTPSAEQTSKEPQPQHSAVEPPEVSYMTLDPNSTCPEYNTLDIMKRSSENTKSSEGQYLDYYNIVN